MKGEKLLTKIWIISILNIILAVAFLYLPIFEVEYKSGKASLSIMEYFEIFLGRMLMCRKAADKLALSFKLVINDQQFI